MVIINNLSINIFTPRCTNLHIKHLDDHIILRLNTTAPLCVKCACAAITLYRAEFEQKTHLSPHGSRENSYISDWLRLTNQVTWGAAQVSKSGINVSLALRKCLNNSDCRQRTFLHKSARLSLQV